MGIYLLIGILTLIVVVVILEVYDKSEIRWFGLLIFLSIPMTLVPFHIPSYYPDVQEYPYHARVTINNDNRQTDIYFSEFQQEGNELVISQYCIGETFHWTDFSGYNVINTPLKIILIDNDDKFIYENRLTNEAYNSKDFATQP